MKEGCRCPLPPLYHTRPTCLNNIPLSNESRIHSHIHTRMQASHGKAELSKSVIKTDDNGKCFRQIRVLMVPKFQKWWNIEEKFLWPNRDLNPGTLKWESDALWPTPSEPLSSKNRGGEKTENFKLVSNINMAQF